MITFNFHSKNGKSCTGEKTRITKVRVLVDDEVIARGHTVLNPNEKDHKVLGQKWALTRTLEQTELDKETKRDIWKAFFEHSKAAQSLLKNNNNG